MCRLAASDAVDALLRFARELAMSSLLQSGSRPGQESNVSCLMSNELAMSSLLQSGAPTGGACPARRLELPNLTHWLFEPAASGAARPHVAAARVLGWLNGVERARQHANERMDDREGNAAADAPVSTHAVN